MLDKPFTIEGIVIKGDQVGRKLGFPTANLAFTDKDQALLARGFALEESRFGLYFGSAKLPSIVKPNIHSLPALIFIGPRLVLSETKVMWEVHIINENSGEAWREDALLTNRNDLRNSTKPNSLSNSESYLGVNSSNATAASTIPAMDSRAFPEFYGATLQITLLGKLRDNMYFHSLEALKVQMQKDFEQAQLHIAKMYPYI